MARVYAVASSKGGVGKTTTTANLSATLAAAGYDVAVVDGDIGMANLGNQLGIAADGATLHDVLAGEASVEEATYEGPHELAVVPGDTALTAFSTADITKLGTVLGSFADRDFVFVDTGAGLSHETALPVGLADEVLLVATADRDALGDTEKTRELAARLDVDVAGAVLNRVTDREDDTGALQVEVLGRIPEDETLRQAGNAGIPVTMYDPDSSTAAAFRGVASSIADGPVRPPVAAQGTADAAAGETDADETNVVVTEAADDDAEPDDANAGADADEPVEIPDDAGDGSAGTDVESDGVTVEPDPESDVSHPDPEPVADDGTAADAAEAPGGTEAATGTPADDEGEDISDAEGDVIPDAEGDGTGTAEEDEAIPFAGSDRDEDEDADAPMVEQEADDESDGEEKKRGFLSRLFG